MNLMLVVSIPRMASQMGMDFQAFLDWIYQFARAEAAFWFSG